MAKSWNYTSLDSEGYAHFSGKSQEAADKYAVNNLKSDDVMNWNEERAEKI